MKKKLLLMLLAIGLVVGATQANLLVNPSFEDGIFSANVPPLYWLDSDASYTSNMTWIDSAAGAHSGSKYIRMQAWPTGTTAYLWQAVEIKPEANYEFSVWAKSLTSGYNKAVLYVEWYSTSSVLSEDATGFIQSSVASADIFGTEWENVYFGADWIPPEGAIFSQVWLAAEGLPIYYDDVYMSLTPAKDPSPEDGSYVHNGDVDLSWTNMPLDPNDPDDPNLANPVTSVYVQVLFGTEPNELSPGYNMEPLDLGGVPDPNIGQDVNSITVSAAAEGTYYWQVNSYLLGDPATTSYNTNPGDPCAIEGHVWSIIAKVDTPPVSVDAGVDMITWSGEPVTMNPNIVDDGQSPLSYHWTADTVYAVFEPNEFVESPTVTVIPDTNNIWVSNPSFEHPVLADGSRISVAFANGWTAGFYGYASGSWYNGTQGGVHNVVNPNAGYGYGGVAPESRNIVEVNTSTAERSGVSQDLPANVEANTTYTLSFKVGTPDVIQAGKYAVELLAGHRPFMIIEDIVPDKNTWESVSKSFYVDGTDPSDPNYPNVGRPLKIRLLGVKGLVSTLNFDDVVLAATSDVPSTDSFAVGVSLQVSDEGNPESVTGSMTIEVYEDECMAARGIGQQPDPDTDIVLDCVIDTKDLGEMINAWLDDKSIEAQHKSERVLYYDDFSGDGLSTLDGTVPDTIPGTSESWISFEEILNDGSRPVPTVSPHRSAVLQFVPKGDHVYQLSATINFSGIDGWMVFGFTENAAVTSWVHEEMSPVGHIMQFSDGALTSATGPINEGAAGLDTTIVGPTDVMIELDTNADPWTLEWFVAPAGSPLVSLRGPVPYEYTPNINYVGIGFFAGADGSFDDFKLHEGPIPPPPGYLVDAGSSWATSKGESITINDANAPAGTYAWTVDDPNYTADVVITGGTTLTPTVTFNGSTTDNPTIIELTLDYNGSDSDTTKMYVYDEGCKAGIGIGQDLDLADFDQDCNTQLEDFAEVAKAWLDDFNLTAPIPKPSP